MKRTLFRTSVAIFFYYVLFVYPPLRLLDLHDVQWQSTIVLLCITVMPAVLRASQELMHNATTRFFSALSFTWLGVCFQLFPLVVVHDLINRVVAIPAGFSAPVLSALISLLAVGGFINAQVIRIRPITIEAGDTVAGIKVIHISDAHIGSRSPGLLNRIVKKANAANPDYVWITGDLIDFSNITKQHLAPLAQLNAPVFYVIGNHERYVDLKQIDQRLRELGLNVLRNESVEHGPFQLIGIDDAERKTMVSEQLAHITVSADRYPVLLYHRPDGLEAAARAGIRLMLCGHTHSGQLVPFNFIVKRYFPRMQGLFRVDNTTLYVSSGVGTWGPVLRIGSRSEMALIKFEPSAARNKEPSAAINKEPS